MASLKYWLWLSTRRRLVPRAVLCLLDHFVTPEQIYHADPEEYAMVEGLPASVRRTLMDKDTRTVDRILADCDRLGLRIMTWQDADYPERLRQIPDPPSVLYIKGKCPVFDEEVAIGVVGAREPSNYGERMAGQIGFELARGGALVVSGIAKGLDAAALRGALKAGGPVVSVLAGGTDVYYPYENRFLYQDVAAAGALISEYPPGTENTGYHFPIRNRIISGLSLGVVAIECRERSGTMSTMNKVLDQNRDAFAVPGQADAPMSQGTNQLIQQGAKLVSCGNDILMEYRDRFPAKLSGNIPLGPQVRQQRLEDEAPERAADAAPVQQPSAPAGDTRELVPLEEQRGRFTDDELELLRAMGDKRCSADELVELTQIPVRRVTSALTMLQVRAAVDEAPGRRFSALVRLED